jgi:hypothetical protein
MSDTPETDGEWNRIACYDHPQFEQGIADFARQLERERDAFEKELAYVREVLLDAMPNAHGSTKKLAEMLVQERDEAIQARKVSAADWLNQITNADLRVTRIKRERDEARFDLAFRRELYALQELQLSEARELAANLEISLTAAIRSANVRQDEAEHAMAERDKAVSSCQIWQVGYRALLDERDLWKAEAERWRNCQKDD